MNLLLAVVTGLVALYVVAHLVALVAVVWRMDPALREQLERLSMRREQRRQLLAALHG